MLKVRLASCGNPDFGQNPNKSISPKKNVIVKDLKEASAACLEYISKHELGGGNWAGGQVFNENGHPYAYISYNGRCWLPADDADGNKEFNSSSKPHPDWITV